MKQFFRILLLVVLLLNIMIAVVESNKSHSKKSKSHSKKTVKAHKVQKAHKAQTVKALKVHKAHKALKVHKAHKKNKQFMYTEVDKVDDMFPIVKDTTPGENYITTKANDKTQLSSDGFFSSRGQVYHTKEATIPYGTGYSYGKWTTKAKSQDRRRRR